MAENVFRREDFHAPPEVKEIVFGNGSTITIGPGEVVRGYPYELRDADGKVVGYCGSDEQAHRILRGEFESGNPAEVFRREHVNERPEAVTAMFELDTPNRNNTVFPPASVYGLVSQGAYEFEPTEFESKATLVIPTDGADPHHVVLDRKEA